MTLAPGTAVRVSPRPRAGHHRTPGYLKGRHGIVERMHGSFLDPESRAYGGDGRPERDLYLVSFDLGDGDRVLADLFDHWLEPAT